MTRTPAEPGQPSLFGPIGDGQAAASPRLPEGLRYQADLITPEEELALIAEIATLPFEPFKFHGYIAKRRAVSFGWRSGARRSPAAADPLPAFLAPLRDKVAAFAGLNAEAFQHALALEYAPGAGIGWHRDQAPFEVIAGVSLASACPFRLRRRTEGGWRRATLTAAPRSAYLLSGPARWDWEHSIAPLEALRYSVTFRTLR